MILRKHTYLYEDYILKKCMNYYIIEGKGTQDFEIREFNLKTIAKDYLELGKNLFLKIENIDFFSRIFIKNPKKWNIVLLPYNPEPNKKVESPKNFTFSIQTFDINTMQNTDNNSIIKIKNYETLECNKEVVDLLINFCKKYGMPYYENLDMTEIIDGLNSGIPLSINAKDFIFTAITIYLLNELDNLINDNNNDNLKKLIKIMSLPDSSSKEDIQRKYNYYLTSLRELYEQQLSFYKGYSNPIFIVNDNFSKDNAVVNTVNLVAALAYYFYHQLELDGEPKICAKCHNIAPYLIKHLCDDCYDKDPNYYINTKRSELNSIHRELKEKLQSLKNNKINEELKKDPYNIRNPKKGDLDFLINLCKNNNLI